MPGSFSLDIGRFVQTATGHMDRMVRKVAVEISTRVIMRTPVRTGRARANWQPGIGALSSGILEKSDREGDLTIGNVVSATRDLKAGEAFYLVNNLEYIGGLEYGRSDKAPQGMLRVTLREYPAIVSKSMNEAKSETA